jgi:diguanylate cyclase (GGDEF)-like protein
MELVLIAVAAAAATGLAGFWFVRARRDAAWDRDGWRQLDRLSPELVGQLEETAILRIALADSLVLFRCDAVLVVLHPLDGTGGLVASLTSADDEQVLVRTLPAGQVVPDPAADSIVVPLMGSGQPIGELRVVGGSRSGHRVRRRLVNGFAHMLGSSLTAERMYDAQRRVTEDTYRRTLRDDLTGLGNRALLHERGNQYLTRSEAQGRHSALLLMDLDDFKRINDTLGHDAGDRVLVEVARRLKGAVRESDLAIRLGGDEFAVLTGDLHDPAEAERVAERLLLSFMPPVLIDDVQLQVNASVGVAVHGADGDTVEDLVRAADEAMYLAKAEGPGHWRRRADGSSTLPAIADLEQQLRAGVPDEELVVHYQPQVDAIDERVTGFEALLRWQHPELGLLPPDDFLPIAERSGLMNPLTRMVLDRALEDLRQLRRDAPGATVSVNISGRNLLSQGLVSDLTSALRRHTVEPSSLVVEITEPAPGPSHAIGAALDGLRRAGCQVSIHEFGSGQSSVTALSQYVAIRETKIHPSLAGRGREDRAAERLVHAMVQTAHSLDVRVVAEGVESAEVGDRLRELGCDRLQGFRVHEPAPRAAITSWLAGRPAPESPAATGTKGART